jgi:hypothetical protein
MKTLLLSLTILFNTSSAFSNYETTTEYPVVKDTVFTGGAQSITDILGHTAALLLARSKAKKDMKKQCGQLYTFGLTRCSSDLKIKGFFAESSSETECGASITPRCVFASSSYISEVVGAPRVLNILLKSEVSKVSFGACKLTKKYGSYNITGLRLLTKTFGAVKNPKVDLKSLNLISFDGVVADSKFIDQSPVEIGASIEVSKVEVYSNEQMTEILKNKTLINQLSYVNTYSYDYESAKAYRMVNYNIR